MNGGTGPFSYAQNSSYQKGAIEAAEPFIRMEINGKLDVTKHCVSSSPNIFRIADFGCSSGPNTLVAVHIITETVKQKFKPSPPPEFEVFFNDRLDNDFNTLFALLPPERSYTAAGLPGSFYGKLLPKSSLNFVYSSCALCWLSELPKEMRDKTSPAFNKGRIHYTGAPKEVETAYLSQYKKDFGSFLRARAEELADSGLMALIVPGVADGFLESQASTGSEFDLLGSCLMDMSNEGKIREEEVDSFNLPIYYATPTQVAEIMLESNGVWKIERMEILESKNAQSSMPGINSRVLYLRAVLEGLLRTHFGHHILDDLFYRYSLKLDRSSFILNPRCHKSIMIFALLTLR